MVVEEKGKQNPAQNLWSYLESPFFPLTLVFSLLCSVFQPDCITKKIYTLVGAHKSILHSFSSYKIYCKYINCCITNGPNINVYINLYLLSHNFCRLEILLYLYWLYNSECLTTAIEMPQSHLKVEFEKDLFVDAFIGCHISQFDFCSCDKHHD